MVNVRDSAVFRQEVCTELQEKGLAKEQPFLKLSSQAGLNCETPINISPENTPKLSPVLAFSSKYDSPLFIRKSDGGYTYDTTDLAAARFRAKELVHALPYAIGGNNLSFLTTPYLHTGSHSCVLCC